MNSEDKRVRSVNFSCKEEMTLKALINKYKHQIESKKNERYTNLLKRKAWEEICQEFNSICGETYRSQVTLKSKYENMKKKMKAKGKIGSEMLNEEKPNEHINIMEWEIENEPEQDDTSEVKIKAENDDSQIISSKNFEDLENENTSFGCSPELSCHYHPSSPLRLSDPEQEKVFPREHSLNKFKDLEIDELERMELIDLKKKYLREEHKLKMKLMLDLHEKEILMRERESEERLNLLKIEHKRKLEYLEKFSVIKD